MVTQKPNLGCVVCGDKSEHSLQSTFIRYRRHASSSIPSPLYLSLSLSMSQATASSVLSAPSAPSAPLVSPRRVPLAHGNDETGAVKRMVAIVRDHAFTLALAKWSSKPLSIVNEVLGLSKNQQLIREYCETIEDPQEHQVAVERLNTAIKYKLQKAVIDYRCKHRRTANAPRVSSVAPPATTPTPAPVEGSSASNPRRRRKAYDGWPDAKRHRPTACKVPRYPQGVQCRQTADETRSRSAGASRSDDTRSRGDATTAADAMVVMARSVAVAESTIDTSEFSRDDTLARWSYDIVKFLYKEAKELYESSQSSSSPPPPKKLVDRVMRHFDEDIRDAWIGRRRCSAVPSFNDRVDFETIVSNQVLKRVARKLYQIKTPASRSADQSQSDTESEDTERDPGRDDTERDPPHEETAKRDVDQDTKRGGEEDDSSKEWSRGGATTRRRPTPRTRFQPNP